MRVQTRFNDEDNQGHVNHVAILEYIAEARIAMLDAALRAADCAWLDYVLVHVSADFGAPIHHKDTVYVLSAVGRVGAKSVTTEYRVLKDEDVQCAQATCVNVFFGRGSPNVAVPIPPRLRDALLNHLICPQANGDGGPVALAKVAGSTG